MTAAETGSTQVIDAVGEAVEEDDRSRQCAGAVGRPTSPESATRTPGEALPEWMRSGAVTRCACPSRTAMAVEA
jgi:hypothetical protein